MTIQKILYNQGLNDKQIKVYLACLEIGSASVHKISQKAELIRTTVYEILESLKRKGFVNSFLKKGVKYFSAQDPEQILRLAQNQVEDLKNILPELNALNRKSKTRPSVRFYQGKDGIKLIMEEALKEAKELIGFNNIDELLTELGDYHVRFVERRIQKKIPIRLILEDSPKARERQRSAQEHLRKVKIISSDYDFSGFIFIWNNKIAMFSFVNDLMVTVIESQVLANTQKAMFDSLWDSLD